MRPIPAEFEIMGTYFPPLLVDAILGIMLMIITVNIMNHYRLSRYLFFPNLMMLCFTIIYTIAIGTFLIPT